MKAGMITRRVDGAPYQPGETVRVTCSTESVASQCGVHEHIGRVGTVRHLEYFCGCGQRYPDMPMIGVTFDDGRWEEFWPEELEGEVSP
jgi:hypothetical protein